MTAKREMLEIDWRQYQRCTSCWELKEASDKYFHRNCGTKNWYLSKCKECVCKYQREYHIKNKEVQNKRSTEWKKNNPDKVNTYKEKNKERIKDWNSEYHKKSEHYKEYMKDYEMKNKDKIRDRKKKKRWEMWYWAMHIKTPRLIKKLWIRPKVCPICWEERRVEAHHPDNNIWYEIVFCCTQCHQRIHNWRMECPKPINLLEIKYMI